MERRDAYTLGFNACCNDEVRNPFKWGRHPELRRAWNEGWYAALDFITN